MVTNELNNDSTYIYDPLVSYKDVFKEKHHQNASEYFDKMVDESKINIPENQETVKQIKKLQAESNEEAKQIRKLQSTQGFLIFLIIVGLAGIGYSIYQIVEFSLMTPYLYIAIGSGVLIILFIVIITQSIVPKTKKLKQAKAELDRKISELKTKATQQMAPLNALFKRGMHIELFKKTLPQIILDKMFDSRRLDYLINKFGYQPNLDKNRSTLFVQSGDMYGNPFFFCKDLIHQLGTKTYSGSIVITWTTTTTINGKTYTEYHSQTLTATVTKPCPYYSNSTYLIYGNEAAPDLFFSRQDSDAELMDQKKIDRVVNKDIKKLNRASEKSTMNGANYTVMANSEFEVLWGAKNRNNEVQFRLLFTPLAQKQMLDLMKDKEIAYGDDFDFVKRNMINYIYPEHLARINMEREPGSFTGYDYEAMKRDFIGYNDEYFKSVYFAFAPIFAIPLYQQQKPHEYIYKDLYNSYVSFYEHEKVANKMNANEFKHPLSQTENILKTTVVKSDKNCDTIQVTAYGYQTVNRTDIIWVFGGDGRNHQVPVNWVEYIPVEKNTVMEVNIVTEAKELTPAEKFKQMVEDLKNRKISANDMYNLGTFFVYTIK